MARLDHVALGVSDLATLRDWYTSVLGLRVEFDAPGAVGLTDDRDVTPTLADQPGPPSRCNLYFQVDDVAATHAALVARGIAGRYPEVGE
jgi:catechol 2,3-dioxygenase-like lactoylglutathione lyase family enzyme